MYLTEEEAREKGCPVSNSMIAAMLAAMVDPKRATINGGEDIRLGFCIASQCMAWRWKQPGKFEAIQKYREEHGCSVREAKEYVDREHPELTMEKTHGYCGLAGRP